MLPQVRTLPRTLPRVLALVASIAAAQSAFALQAISDDEMAGATGEGIAFLPENFSMVFDPTTYINLIPRGPTLAGTDKADLFVYGVSVGASNSGKDEDTARTLAELNDTRVAPVRSFGTANNPWLLRSFTPTGYVNYAGAADNNRAVLALEAPEYQKAADTAFKASSADAYNLKTVAWLDVMSRNGAVAGSTNDPTGATNQFRNRLRLQVVQDGYSLNGTKLNIFQTDDLTAINANYNRTLGIAAVVRLNSGDGGVLRLSTALKDLTTANAFEPNMITTPATGGISPFVQGTSAENTFDPDEGLFLTNADINLPLGQLFYQPLMIRSAAAADGVPNNLVVELARIPNTANVYNRFYTDYGVGQGGTGASTAANILARNCSTLSCGTLTTPATHGNVTIGNVFVDPATGLADATRLANGAVITNANATQANGVVFRAVDGTPTNLGNANISGLLIQHLKLTVNGL